jgi:Ca2+-binding EF-hand superfamily protein
MKPTATTLVLSAASFILLGSSALALDCPRFTNIDTDNNGKVSQSEANAWSKAEFTRLDQDRNDGISPTEWEQCENLPGDMSAASSSPPASTTESSSGATGATPSEMAPFDQEDFSSYDTDKSGDLSADEAAKASESGKQARGADQEATARQLALRFSAADLNGDGKLSKEEWTARKVVNPKVRFDRIDADRNGSISTEEWTKFRNARLESAQQQSQAGEPGLWIFYFRAL